MRALGPECAGPSAQVAHQDTRRLFIGLDTDMDVRESTFLRTNVEVGGLVVDDRSLSLSLSRKLKISTTFLLVLGLRRHILLLISMGAAFSQHIV
ncbi:hypothetical protein MUK42_28594 [Musa troglodytarum]|uniref:Uncharacterized protein n=1 Tax=Musa troglodytarum TaxID=320322 RepID=A0A9E7KCV3_9LILI|nr:hypothetical protein MUK42_28594 [Musa troglodytarum]